MQALLAWLRSHGLDGCVPEPLGIDEEGFDAVGWIPGTVPAYPMPAWIWHEEVLVACARLLRRLHDATAGFPCAGRLWQLPAHEPAEVVCHNDFAPYNLVFDERHELAGVIDFEAASPGPRAWDLAYLAYRIVPLTAPDNPDGRAGAPGERRERLARLCEAYGGIAPGDVLSLVPDRLLELAAISIPVHARLYERDAEWISATNGAG